MERLTKQTQQNDGIVIQRNNPIITRKRAINIAYQRLYLNDAINFQRLISEAYKEVEDMSLNEYIQLRNFIKNTTKHLINMNSDGIVT